MSPLKSPPFTIFTDFDYSLAVQLNFHNFSNFSNFRNQCFAVFRQVSQIVFRKFRKHEFRKVLQILVLLQSQIYVCFARLAKFRK